MESGSVLPVRQECHFSHIVISIYKMRQLRVMYNCQEIQFYVFDYLMPGLPVLDLEIIKCRVLLISNFSQWRFQKIVFPPGSPAYTLFGTGFWECWP